MALIPAASPQSPQVSARDPMRQLVATAEEGDPVAQFNLGVVYDNRWTEIGHSAGDSHKEALKWLRRAARQGLARAQSRLAEMYAGQPNTPARDIKACAWFLFAIEGLAGAPRHNAQSGYTRASARLKPAEEAMAQRLARAWKQKCVNPPLATEATSRG